MQWIFGDVDTIKEMSLPWVNSINSKQILRFILSTIRIIHKNNFYFWIILKQKIDYIFQ